jgi:plastocyanin
MPTSAGRKARIAIAAAAVSLGAYACASSDGGDSQAMGMSSESSGSDGSTPTTGMHTGMQMAPNEAMVTIKDYAFMGSTPATAGGQVMVMNEDAEAHTVTADDGSSFDVTVSPGQSVVFTAPSKPGRYPFHCSLHSSMHGVLVVK